MSNKNHSKQFVFNEQQKKKATYLFWFIAMFPILFITCLLLFQSEDDLPPVAMLNHPPELLASVVYADDGESELGRYWKINRTSVPYKAISPYVTDALISTEDERFIEHSGVDFKAIGRAVVSVGGAGGASTISQQLAKLLFTLQQREKEDIARANGIAYSGSSGGKIGRLFSRIGEKARENIIATRLEQRFTKEEIITMYLNQFDFLYNAVGIDNAAKVYFNKKPKDLTKDEAAMLIGMCKNPTLYNPHSFQIKDYRSYLANQNEVPESSITRVQIQEKRAEDSLRAVSRRNQVLFQWLKNSKSKSEALRVPLTQEEYDKLTKKPLHCNFQEVDHKRGMAPYFREGLRKELTNLLLEKKPDGTLKYKREDGAPWDIYRDGLKIYTTINIEMQEHAEEAMQRHLKENLQPAFDDNNRHLKHFPFSNDATEEEIDGIMRSGRLSSHRYMQMEAKGASNAEVRKAFNTPVTMRVYTWGGEKDTTMTPDDSIRYYKSFLHAGLISIQPETGEVKAWVGGVNIDHFAYDHVRQGKRQVGSTIKPFVYASALAMGVVKPCDMIPDIAHCVDLRNSDGVIDDRWCPKNAGGMSGGSCSVANGLAQSKNNITVAVMAKMGSIAGPKTIEKLLKNMDISLPANSVVPAMCLGSMDLSLFEMVGAQAMFVNHGIYNRPTTILRIEDRNGNVIYNAKPYSKEVLNEKVAYETLKMMEGVVRYGTAGSLRGGQSWGNITAPTAGKTGTTQNNSDGWFIGLTPELVTGVWVGAEDRLVRFRSMNWGQGGRMALPIYGYFMQKVYKNPKIGISTTAFDKPEDFDDSEFSCSGQILPPAADDPAADSLEIELGI
ncbi:MAG: transglycosylase domain-containing protein [Flavobacteriia bacterium]|nr:transglycosylase domain-containing protein [Flavobacteriia bacterium]